MSQLLPDRLKELWARVHTGQLTSGAAQQDQEKWLAEYRELWTRALTTPEMPNLKTALMTELAAYLGSADVVGLEARCRLIGEELKAQWDRSVSDPRDRSVVERFYDQSQGYLLDLMWWHTLEDDASPLAYVLALEFARRCPGKSYLDFGGASDPAPSSLLVAATPSRRRMSARRCSTSARGGSLDGISA